jgi:hypothetical protein
MGVARRKLIQREERLLRCAGLQTVSGKVHVRWEESCPLAYASPIAPRKADVQGTWMLSVLSGH